MLVAVAMALVVGFLIGNRYEKMKLSPMMDTLQKQVDDLKMKATSMDKTNMTGVMMKDGKMMTVWKDGKTDMMTENVTMSDGTKVMMDGKIVKPDGTSMMMKEGQDIGMNGQMMAK